MPSFTDPIVTLQRQVRQLLATVSSFQGQPANATFSVPHNDSWIFEDNVDATHAANLRYIVSKNVTRVVSARLSIFMAPYRTYNNFSATTTAGQSNTHTHTGPSHNHTWHIASVGGTATMKSDGAGGVSDNTFSASDVPTTSAGTGATGGASADHTHLISVTSTLGVTEGATATGVTVAFDGVDATAALGGPFNANVIELDVRRFIQTSQGVKHTIAMQPSGLGRIEAHLRLGVYVSASQVL